MLQGAFLWIAYFAIAAMAFVGTILLAFVSQRLGGTAIESYVRRRQRRLLPRVLHSVADPSAVPELQRALRPFDLALVREMLMRLAIDVREEDGTDIVRVCSRLGLLEREIRSLSSWRSRTRRRAAANLGLLRQTAALPPLLRLLDDRNANVRLAAIDAIGDIACEQGLIELIPLLGDQEPAVAWRVQEALCRGGVDVGLQLVRFVALTEDLHARAAAIELLRWMRPDRAEARLCVLAQAISPGLRADAARSLSGLRTEGSGTVLRGLLSDSSTKVRLQAVHGLRALARPDSVPDLCGALLDESRLVRVQAARALAELGDAGITSLLETLTSGGSEAGSPPAGVPDARTASGVEGDGAGAPGAPLPSIRSTRGPDEAGAGSPLVPLLSTEGGARSPRASVTWKAVSKRILAWTHPES